MTGHINQVQLAFITTSFVLFTNTTDLDFIEIPLVKIIIKIIYTLKYIEWKMWTITKSI